MSKNLIKVKIHIPLLILEKPNKKLQKISTMINIVINILLKKANTENQVSTKNAFFIDLYHKNLTVVYKKMPELVCKNITICSQDVFIVKMPCLHYLLF